MYLIIIVLLIFIVPIILFKVLGLATNNLLEIILIGPHIIRYAWYKLYSFIKDCVWITFEELREIFIFKKWFYERNEGKDWYNAAVNMLMDEDYEKYYYLYSSNNGVFRDIEKHVDIFDTQRIPLSVRLKWKTKNPYQIQDKIKLSLINDIRDAHYDINFSIREHTHESSEECQLYINGYAFKTIYFESSTNNENGTIKKILRNEYKIDGGNNKFLNL